MNYLRAVGTEMWDLGLIYPHQIFPIDGLTREEIQSILDKYMQDHPYMFQTIDGKKYIRTV